MLLNECARVIRSKNAGPFTLTLDIFFSSVETYQLAQAARCSLQPEWPTRMASLSTR